MRVARWQRMRHHQRWASGCFSDSDGDGFLSALEAASSQGNGEVASLAELYREVEGESDIALKPVSNPIVEGELVLWPRSKPLPDGWLRPTVWESTGLWRFRWKEPATKANRCGSQVGHVRDHASGQPCPPSLPGLATRFRNRVRAAKDTGDSLTATFKQLVEFERVQFVQVVWILGGVHSSHGTKRLKRFGQRVLTGHRGFRHLP